ncbi:MAG: GNAT family N-acetyltransferase [Oligoflexus sp.]
MDGIHIEKLTGQGIADRITDLARLRIEVFREFPYLYEGSLAYEEKYLETYIRAADAAVFLVSDQGRPVGASTALPLPAEEASFQKPFLDENLDPRQYFYFGESVLLAPYRGKGIGVQFFDVREAHAQAVGPYVHSCFCAVERPVDHPLKPADYQPLDDFWRKRGYEKSKLRTGFTWKDIDQASETEKLMNFWMKKLACTAI